MSRSQIDLWLTASVAIVTCALVAIGAPTTAMVVPGILLFAAPGYLLGQILLGSQITGLERVVVITGLVFCVPILGGLLLNVAGVPLERPAWLGLLTGATLVEDVVLFLRRRSTSTANFGRQRDGWHLSLRNSVGFGAAIALAVCAVAVARAGAAMQHYPGFTQLWLVRSDSTAPIVNLGVGNHEGRTMRYRVVLMRNGHPVSTWNIILGNDQSWHRSPRYPGHFTISANLYRLPDVSQPYRHVALDGDGPPPA